MSANIAIIDDDASVRTCLQDLLRSLGYAADNFSSAESFLDWISANDASCVITDVKMPGMSGVELQTRLKTEGRHLPMIFMTAFPEEGVKEQVLKAGAIGFLTKPFQQQSLLDCLGRTLRR